MGESAKVVQGFQAAMARDDWSAARAFLADDLAFVGPFESFNRPEGYLKGLQRLHPVVERVDVHHLFEDGPDVCVLYDLVTNTAAGTSFVAEWHTVRAGNIASIRVVFDARPFAPMFAAAGAGGPSQGPPAP